VWLALSSHCGLDRAGLWASACCCTSTGYPAAWHTPDTE
jgi:hypothetical protein